MSNVPDDMIPDGPKRIGGPTESDLVVDGGIYPGEASDSDVGVGVCDSCEEETRVYYGVGVDTGEPRAICLFCRIKYAAGGLGTSE
jgi:hypothetical protein